MANIFHRWLNPHCADCHIETECKTCDTLRQLLEAERRTNKDLLYSLLHPNEQTAPIENEVKDYVPIRRDNSIPWKIRQQTLETEDRKKALLVREKELELKARNITNETKERIEKLEEELGVDDVSKEKVN